MATNNSVNNTTTPFTSATNITVTAGDFTLTSGRLLSNAVSSSTVGCVLIGGTTPGANTAIQARGTNCLFFGNLAGNFTLTTSRCFAMGSSAGNALTSAGTGGLIAIGYQAAKALTSATFACALGYQSALHVTTGSDSCVIGESNLNASTITGARNNCWGYNACTNYTSTEHDNICWNAAGTVAENTVLRLGTAGTGNGQVSTSYIAGINGVTVTGTAMLCATDGQLGTVASSQKFKENVQDMGDFSSSIFKMRPVTFCYKIDKEQLEQRGLIAEEVAKIMPNLVVYDEEGPFSVKYHDICSLLINEFKKLSQTISELEGALNGNS